MKMNLQLTESLEDYLEAIAELIAVEGHAHTKEIAEKLNILKITHLTLKTPSLYCK